MSIAAFDRTGGDIHLHWSHPSSPLPCWRWAALGSLAFHAFLLILFAGITVTHLPPPAPLDTRAELDLVPGNDALPTKTLELDPSQRWGGSSYSYLLSGPSWLDEDAILEVLPFDNSPLNTNISGPHPIMTVAEVQAMLKQNPDWRAVPVTVRLPAQAQLWFGQTRMKQAGPVRHFITPPLLPGESCTYEATATWLVGSQVVTISWVIKVNSRINGLTIDFNP